MPTKDLEFVNNIIDSSLTTQSPYTKAMKQTLVFVSELYILWQIVMYGLLNVSILPCTISGAVLLLSTYITYKIYKRNVDDLVAHAKIIQESYDKPPAEQRKNIIKFAQVFEKYKIGRISILCMNTITSLYVMIFAMVTLALHL